MQKAEGAFTAHLEKLRNCRLCPDVLPPPVTGAVAGARIYLMGQAPGPKEMEEGRPFVWTSGRKLFQWFSSLGVTEEEFRRKVYMGAVIRCFPGKIPGKDGDRKPSLRETGLCRGHFEAELEILRPELVIAVGKLAIEQLMECRRLDDVVGRSFRITINGQEFSCIPLPHPSGLSRWIQTEKGKAMINQALEEISSHQVWQATFGGNK